MKKKYSPRKGTKTTQNYTKQTLFDSEQKIMRNKQRKTTISQHI